MPAGKDEASGVVRHIAFDLGAESGRAILGSFVDGGLHLEELHRWSSRNTEVHGTRYWDVLYIFSEMKAGLRKYVERYGGRVDGVGVDTWGVDFGVLGESGQMLQNPVQYRDRRTDGMPEKCYEIVSRARIYEITGIQFMSINTLYQLRALQETAPEVLRAGKTLLMMPDVLHYFLSGSKQCEYTMASTSQLLDVHARDWSEELFDAFGLPLEIMPEVVQPGTVAGALDAGVAKETGLKHAPVILPCSHDTGSAVLAVPAEGENWGYISCGTWSLMGVELDAPLTSPAALEAGFTNEGGIGGTIRFLKNIAGLWVYQQARAAWARRGEEYSYAELTEMAAGAPAFQTVIDIDAPLFLNPDDMLDAIARYCKDSGQAPPEGVAAAARAILEGVALRYAVALHRLEGVLGKPLEKIHMVGGGIQNELLCQFASDAMNRPVIAGPVEASAMGNLLTQAIGSGCIADAAAARSLVTAATSPKVYTPRDAARWRPVVERFV